MGLSGRLPDPFGDRHLAGAREAPNLVVFSVLENDLQPVSHVFASPSGRDILLYSDVSGVLPRSRHVVSELHAKKVIHLGSKRLFNAQGHLRR